MLGEPVATIAPPLGVLREIERIAERVGSGPALDDGSEIENGEWNHHSAFFDERAVAQLVVRLL